MPAILTNGSSVTCTHAGSVKVIVADKLTVQGKPVLVGLGAVTRCTATVAPNVPCAAVTITAGVSTKLFVEGKAVLLNSLKAVAVAPPAIPGGVVVVVPSPVTLSTV